MALKIITANNPGLLKTAKPVKAFDKKLLDLIYEMKQTLINTHDPEGIGLAAPQVGISLQIFLAKKLNENKINVFINPKIIEEKQGKTAKTTKKSILEGCLSIPNIWGKVKRKKELTLIYQDENGKKHQRKITGFLAIIIQHEVDHLNGILFTKHVLTQGNKLYRSYKNEKGEDEFDEIKI